MLIKKQRLQNAKNKSDANKAKLKNQQKLAVDFNRSKNQAEKRFKENEELKKIKEKEIKKAKDVLFKSTRDLFKLRQQDSNLYSQIQSNMAACRNLQSHINKLNTEFQRQQQLLYNAQYQIQLMERKVTGKKEIELQKKKRIYKIKLIMPHRKILKLRKNIKPCNSQQRKLMTIQEQ